MSSSSSADGEEEANEEHEQQDRAPRRSRGEEEGHRRMGDTAKRMYVVRRVRMVLAMVAARLQSWMVPCRPWISRLEKVRGDQDV